MQFLSFCLFVCVGQVIGAKTTSGKSVHLFGIVFFSLVAPVTGAAQIIGDLVTGRAAESGQSFMASQVEEESTDGAPKTEFLVDMLRWRASSRPDDQLFSVVDARVIDLFVFSITSDMYAMCV